MFSKFALSTAAAASALIAFPAAAHAQSRYGYYDGYRYQNSIRGYDRYGRYYREAPRRYVTTRYGSHYGQRCSGTTGTILGAIAGGLLGSEVAGRGDRTVGAILGGAAGALAGRAIDRSDCR